MAIPLGSLRSLSERFLPDTVSIERLTEVETGDGSTVTWASVGSAPCRVSPLGSSASERLGGGQALTSDTQWVVWVPFGTDVTVKDRLVALGRRFEVARVGVRSYEVIRECVCRELI